MNKFVAVRITEHGPTVFGPFDSQDQARWFIAWCPANVGTWDVQEVVSPATTRNTWGEWR